MHVGHVRSTVLGDSLRRVLTLLGHHVVGDNHLGALVKLTGAVKLESLDSPIKERFGRIAPKNQAAAKRAFEEVKIINEGSK